MKNYEIVAIMAAYAKEREEGYLSLPAKVAWKRRLNLKKLADAKQVIDEALIDIERAYSDDEHSEVNGDGARIVKPEYMEEFAKKRTDILSQDTEIEFNTISIEDLGDLSLTDSEMDTIEFMIKEGEN